LKHPVVILSVTRRGFYIRISFAGDMWQKIELSADEKMTRDGFVHNRWIALLVY
jgi:hypothetical protein